MISKLENAIADFTKILEISQANNFISASAYYCRGLCKSHSGNHKDSIRDYTAALNLSGSHSELKVKLLHERSNAYIKENDYENALLDCNTIISMDPLSGEELIDAYLNRGQAKYKRGEALSAIADFTYVLESNKASREEIALGWLQRSIMKFFIGDLADAKADIEHAIQMDINADEFVWRSTFWHLLILNANGVKPDSLVTDCVKLFNSASLDVALMPMVATSWFAGVCAKLDISEINKMLVQFASHLNSANTENARKAVLGFLNQVASKLTKQEWVMAWRGLVANLKPEIFEVISFFEPVCRVLEGQDRSLLDALPPEQREFALDVLAKFDAKSTPGLENAKS